MIRVADLKSFSDGSKDYFAQLKGCALAISSMYGLPTDTQCELIILDGLIRRARVIRCTVDDCIDTGLTVMTLRYDRGDEHTLCDACQYCGRRTDGTCSAQAALVKATAIDMPVTFPVSQAALIANPALAAKVGVIAQAGIKFWESQYAMVKESALQNGGQVDDGEGCKFAFKEVNGRRTCKDLLALVEELNVCGISNDAIITKVGISITALEELMTGLDAATSKAIIAEYFTAETKVKKFERITR